MSGEWIRRLKEVLWIAEKDARIYFFKGPNVTFGLFLPLVLYWAFTLDRDVELMRVVPGLVGIAIFFGAGAIQAVSLPLERRTGTMHALLATPVTPLVIVLGKTLAGLVFGMVLAAVYGAAVTVLAPLQPNLVLFGLASLFSSFCFSGFGLCLAAPFRSVPQAMPPATVVRIFIVFLSGAFAPLKGAPGWRLIAARLLPLPYSLDALGQAVNGPVGGWEFVIALGVLFAYGIIFLGVTGWALGRQEI
ncbi:MAG: ABC transporter permease [Chloroflexota bacterium]